MTVYVDDPKHRYGRMVMCHMLADTEEELHAMADAIGVRRKWFQGDHYDICMVMRRQAVQMGAKEVHARDLVAIRRRFRRNASELDPLSPGQVARVFVALAIMAGSVFLML